MSRRAHVLWQMAVLASGGVFVLSLGSDVWEAYATLAGVVALGYVIALWSKKKRRPSV